MGPATFVALGAALAGAAPELERFEFSETIMAVPVMIKLYAPDAAAASAAAEAAFARVRALNAILSDYDEESELRRLSAAAVRPGGVAVSDDLWRVLGRAQEISAASEGALDVTVGPAVALWRFAKRRHQLPVPGALAEALARVDYRLVRLHPEGRRVELLKADMQLDAGGIAKGYAVDAALKVLRERGLGRAIVDAGGDIAVGDPPPGAAGWRIGVELQKKDAPPERFLSLSRVGIATSGDTRQYVYIGGRRYSHILDPKTGLGMADRRCVAVVAPDATTADALATALSVLDPARGCALADGMPGTAALIVRVPEEKEERHESKGWRSLPEAERPG
jgi:thiamine biosynthesis lipoprotein